MHFGLLGTVQNIVHYNKAIVQFLLDDKEETAILLGNASCTLYSGGDLFQYRGIGQCHHY